MLLSNASWPFLELSDEYNLQGLRPHTQTSLHSILSEEFELTALRARIDSHRGLILGTHSQVTVNSKDDLTL